MAEHFRGYVITGPGEPIPPRPDKEMLIVERINKSIAKMEMRAAAGKNVEANKRRIAELKADLGKTAAKLEAGRDEIDAAIQSANPGGGPPANSGGPA